MRQTGVASRRKVSFRFELCQELDTSRRAGPFLFSGP
jgi:hypothetical protein